MSSPSSTQSPPKLAAWIAATRPRVFVASFVPMGLAGVVALRDGVFQPVMFLLALLGVMALQTAANLINEYADHRRGADELKQAGQSMTLKNRLLSAQEILYGAVASLLVGVTIGLFLLWQSGPALWWIGIGGVLVAITYTAGPFPLAYHGLGEVAAGIFMGPMIVLGAYYVMDSSISAERGVELALLSFPIMFTTAAILHANNLRDLEADRAANKRTLAVIFGRQVARLEYKVLLGVSYLSQVILILIGWYPWTTALSLLTIPQALRLVRVFDEQTDPLVLHLAQGATAQLHGKLGLGIVVGWLLTLLIQTIF
ncbi:MAG: 1,4-dihydroxy-2-naphthoate octaprenyltransferase [Anaerolineae bacterium]|nr:1,4-dihydroxy-2-naphthoate octaprenyltransferase [Anaerolineae bacterium]MDW8170908.1 1,4-dihydroxy-2-naphthoate octaprenyltransferase [Anaerolineae bacterium]